MSQIARLLALAAFALLTTGCIKSMAVGALGDALAEPGGSFGRDDDPDFICESTPFGLKTMESLIEAEPEHEGLHLAATRGFVQYAFACLQTEAERIEDDDFKGARHLRRRAQKMYRRAVRYGVRGLSLILDVKDARDPLRGDTEKTLARFEREHAPMLYWTALGWAAAVAIDKDDVELAADLGLVEAIMLRVEALDPGMDEGSINDFFISWEMATPGGDPAKAKARMEASLAASNNERLSPMLTYAEAVLVPTQNKAEFEDVLQRVLAFDVEQAPRHRLVNLITQRRAALLLSRIDDLFL